jgi:hypothetical protein
MLPVVPRPGRRSPHDGSRVGFSRRFHHYARLQDPLAPKSLKGFRDSLLEKLDVAAILYAIAALVALLR